MQDDSTVGRLGSDRSFEQWFRSSVCVKWLLLTIAPFHIAEWWKAS